VFECVTANNQTDLTLQFYNGTAACDNTALVTYTSSAASHTCAEIDLTFEGQTYTAYGHIRCEDDRVSALSSSVAGAQKMAPKKVQPTAVEAKKGRLSKLFQ
jgi:beta-mannanase